MSSSILPKVEPIGDDMPGWHQCVDCGATARPGETVIHYDACRPGSADFWEKFYADAADEICETLEEEE